MNEPKNGQKVINDPEVTINLVLNTPALKISDLANIRAGEILRLNQKVSDQLNIEVNGKIVGRVELMEMDGYYALKLQEVIGG